MKWLLLALLPALVVGGWWLWTPDREPAVLEAKYANAPADFIAVAGIRLHVRDSGPKDAPAILLLHGFGASLHTWEAWAGALEREFRVIRFDLAGHGLTGPDPGGDYTDARALAIMVALMDKLGLARASVGGNSIGGRIAWTFAAAYPARVDKLLLVSPDGFASPGFEYGKAPEVHPVFNAMRWVLPKALMRMNLAPAYTDPSHITDDAVTRYHDLLLRPGNRQALLDRMRQIVLSDPLPRLKQIQAPTLLLWGAKDAMIPIANAQDYLRVMPNAKLVTLPDLGHVPQEEAPERSLPPVLAFLKN